MSVFRSLLTLVSVVGLTVAPTAAPAMTMTDDGPDTTTTVSKIGWITLDGAVAEKPDPLLAILGDPDDQTTIRNLVAKFDAAATRGDIEALVVNIEAAAMNRSQIDAVRNAIDRVQAAGKPVYVFAELYGTAELLIGSAADEMYIQPGGVVSFPGIYAEEIFLADTFRMIGIEPDFLQIGDYKGASEQYANTEPSEEWSENIENLLDDMWAQNCEALREGRGYNKRELDRVLKKAWMADADVAIELGLLDRVVDERDLRSTIEKRHNVSESTKSLGGSDSGMKIDFKNPFAIFSLLGRKPNYENTRDTLAVIHIDGPIVDGDSAPASLLGGSTVGSRTVRDALKAVEDDDLIKGLIVRINSPGGSAIASEMIWSGVRRVAQKKPVYVSVGSMAASGGYYIAVSGDKIFVDQTSIVGSIGVVSGKLARGGLYDKLHIGVAPRSRGPWAGLLAASREWNNDERAAMRQMMIDVYDLFAKRVVQNRGDKVDMDKIAEGRLFTGRQALENGMADGLADFDGTITMLAQEVGLYDGQFDVKTYPTPKSFEDMLSEMLPFASIQSGANPLAKSIGEAAAGAVLEQVLGAEKWMQIRDSMNALMQLERGGVVLASPRVLTITQ